MPLSLSVIAELVSLLFAIFYYKRLKETIYVYAIPFLLFIIYAEAGAIYHIYAFSKYEVTNGNTHIYLWVSIVETIFYSSFFYKILGNSFVKRMVVLMAILLVGIYLFLFFFFAVYVESYFRIMTLASLYFTILSCIYFYKVFIHVEEENVVALADFWMVTGIFVFFSGTSLSFVLHHTLARPDIRIVGLYLYNLIPQVLSIILYGCFIAAFILCRKKKTI
jgi:hypothetical protein